MQGKKTCVLQLIEGLGKGGAEIKLLELVRCMDKSRFRFIVASLGVTEEKDLAAPFREAGADVLVFQKRRRIDPLLLWRVVQLIRKNHVDIVMTTLFYADVVGHLAGKIAGVKAIVSWETSSSPLFTIGRRRIPYMWTVRFCDRVIAVSSAVARYLKEQRGVPAEKIEVIPYGVDLSRFTHRSPREVRESLGFDRTHFVVGMVARLDPDKGHETLIQSALTLVTRYPRMRFALAGDGTLRKNLEAMVQEKGLSPFFSFLGYRPDIEKVLHAFDVVTLPSLHEGLPNVLLEAMAAGVAVVATAVGGIVDLVVDGETGLLIPPAEPAALENALSCMASHPEKTRRMGAAGRQRVEEYFSLSRQVQAFEEVFGSLMESE